MVFIGDKDKKDATADYICGVACLVVGLFATYKVREGTRGTYEFVITTTIAGIGLSFIGLGLCLSLGEVACIGLNDKTYYTDVNLRDQFLFFALFNLFDLHFWVFSVKYLVKGIEYTRFKSNDKFELLLKGILYSLLFWYEIYVVSLQLVIFRRQPVFKPPKGITQDECTNLRSDFSE